MRQILKWVKGEITIQLNGKVMHNRTVRDVWAARDDPTLRICAGDRELTYDEFAEIPEIDSKIKSLFGAVNKATKAMPVRECNLGTGMRGQVENKGELGGEVVTEVEEEGATGGVAIGTEEEGAIGVEIVSGKLEESRRKHISSSPLEVPPVARVSTDPPSGKTLLRLAVQDMERNWAEFARPSTEDQGGSNLILPALRRSPSVNRGEPIADRSRIRDDRRNEMPSFQRMITAKEALRMIPNFPDRRDRVYIFVNAADSAFQKILPSERTMLLDFLVKQLSNVDPDEFGDYLFTTWEELREHLMGKYQRMDYVDLIHEMSKYSQLKQGTSEDIQDYLRRARVHRRLIDRVRGRPEHREWAKVEVADAHLLRQFVNGLQIDEIKREIQRIRPTTMEEVVDKVIELEVLFNAKQQGSSFASPIKAYGVAGTCKVCEETGHWWRNCPVVRAQMLPKCGICNREHDWRDCPQVRAQVRERTEERIRNERYAPRNVHRPQYQPNYQGHNRRVNDSSERPDYRAGVNNGGYPKPTRQGVFTGRREENNWPRNHNNGMVRRDSQGHGY